MVINTTRLIGLYLSVTLLTLFSGYVLIVLLGAFGRIPCACGGVIELLGWKGHLVFNLFFLLINIQAIRLHKIVMHEQG